MPYGTRGLSLEEKFWSKVDKSGEHWLWMDVPQNGGYGLLRISPEKKELAHRISWTIHFGPIPDELEVLHKCDIRLCVKPDHLFLGDQTDNLRDMMNKGRRIYPRLFGESSHHHKLSLSDVEIIRKLGSDVSAGELSKKFGVTRTQIYNIRKHRSWRVSSSLT